MQRIHTNPTDGAVFSVPAWTALAFAVLAGTVFAAAWMAGPLIAGRTHPALLAAAAARHADAVPATVRRTKLCGRTEEGRKGGRKGNRRPKGKEKTNPEVIVRDRMATLQRLV